MTWCCNRFRSFSLSPFVFSIIAMSCRFCSFSVFHSLFSVSFFLFCSLVALSVSLLCMPAFLFCAENRKFISIFPSTSIGIAPRRTQKKKQSNHLFKFDDLIASIEWIIRSSEWHLPPPLSLPLACLFCLGLVLALVRRRAIYLARITPSKKSNDSHYILTHWRCRCIPFCARKRKMEINRRTEKLLRCTNTSIQLRPLAHFYYAIVNECFLSCAFSVSTFFRHRSSANRNGKMRARARRSQRERTRWRWNGSDQE